MPRFPELMIALVAVLHTGFMVLETFLWRSVFAPKLLRMPPALAESTAALAANQGVYNLFVAAGLVFCLTQNGAANFAALSTFFLAGVVALGLFGAATVSWRIAVVQSLPAAIALGALWLSGTSA